MKLKGHGKEEVSDTDTAEVTKEESSIEDEVSQEQEEALKGVLMPANINLPSRPTRLFLVITSTILIDLFFMIAMMTL